MRIFQNVKFATKPVLIASCPGMGNVGFLATNYLRTKINAQPLAEIDMNPHFVPEAVFVRNGIANLPKVPTARIYFNKNPDVLIFESDAQVSPEGNLAVAKSLVRFAADTGVRQVLTMAALPQNMSHREDVKIFGAFTDKETTEDFEKFGVIPMIEGYVAGFNGVLLGIAKAHSIESGCFLGTVPVFATNLTFPKTSLRMIELIEDITGLEVDKTEIIESIAIADNQFSAIEERIRQFSGALLGDFAVQEPNPLSEILGAQANDNSNETIPQNIMEKIERLFQDVQNDKAHAKNLKKELDRWNVYELYEDRFLKLFKEQ